MDRLRNVINQYGRWQPLLEYVERIEAFSKKDFSLSIENSKALLECIAKEICSSKGVSLASSASMNAVLKTAFDTLGFTRSGQITQISSALATIGQQIGVLRDEIGVTSHGRTLEEIEARNSRFDELSKEFLIDATIIIAIFLIRNFENDNPRVSKVSSPISVDYAEYNEYLDLSYGEFSMGDLSFAASEILFNLDAQAYLSGLKEFKQLQEDNNE